RQTSEVENRVGVPTSRDAKPKQGLEDRIVGNEKGMSRKAEWTVRAMIMYAIIQGGLFASFLPPA
ncbi:ER membrane glycoprotein subunit of the GPI transamidase complex-like protein, partial [Cryomyces antarcticus]